MSPLPQSSSPDSSEIIRPNGAPTYDVSGLHGNDDSAWTNYKTYYEHNKQWAKSGPYVTKLSPSEEANFQQWIKTNKIPWRDSPTADYDMRGYWKAQAGGNQEAKKGGDGHFPDTWKTPYDSTFSNESIYALPTAPHWKGNDLIEIAPRPKSPSPISQFPPSPYQMMMFAPNGMGMNANSMYLNSPYSLRAPETVPASQPPSAVNAVLAGSGNDQANRTSLAPEVSNNENPNPEYLVSPFAFHQVSNSQPSTRAKTFAPSFGPKMAKVRAR